MSTEDDRLEERILLPASQARLVGHEQAREQVLRAFAGGRPHHAWLISGAPGVGKATLAWHLARLLLAFPGESIAEAPVEGVVADHPVFHQLAAGAHPDFFLLRRSRDKKGRLRARMAVEDARALGHFLSLKAGLGGRRVVVVDVADEMNRETANAILKVLEEPPEETFFFLLAHAPGRLLPTIRSRCLHVPLSALSSEQVRAALEGLEALEEVAPERLEAAIAQSAGAPGRALDLATSGAPELWREVERVLAAGPGEPGAARQAVFGRVAQALGQKQARADFPLFCELMEQWLHRRMQEAARAGHTAQAARLADVLADMRERLGALEAVNLDRRQFVVGVLGRVARLMELSSAG